MTDKLMTSNEQVSALVDGQLRGAEFAQTVKLLETRSEARAAWDTYHLVGDVMRSGHAHATAHDAEFIARLRLRMVNHATNPDATKLIATDALSIRAGGQKFSKSASANDGWWKRVAGLASVAAVGMVVWQGFQYTGAGMPGQPLGSPQIAQVAAAPAMAAVQASSSPGGSPMLMLRDPRLDALLAAHRQFGGTSALQMPSGFLRNATFEEGHR